MSPEQAPWGGLPKPTLICGSVRSEMELRVTELWAREFGCPCYPLDFSFPSPPFRALPGDWWNYTRDSWRELVDPARLRLRVEQERTLTNYVEQLTGKTISVAELTQGMARINQQMEYWAQARELICNAPKCPVHIRDQMSMYQAMWHRGTDVGIELVKDYLDEVTQRVAGGVDAYRNERFRLYYHSQIPPWHDFVEEKYGAVTVANFYSGIPDLYARTVYDDDPFEALAARHLFLFGFNAARIVKEATEHRCDAVVVVEAFNDGHPSIEQREVEAAGIPYLALPKEADDATNRALLEAFIEQRLVGRR